MSEFHSEISNLSPAPLWQFFDKICSIPHPSKHEAALAQYIVGWATEQGLDVRRDPTESSSPFSASCPANESGDSCVDGHCAWYPGVEPKKDE